MEIRLGTTIADITPPSPIPLAGYSSRTAPFDDVARPLYVRVWLFEHNGPTGTHKALLVQADLIWWDTAQVVAMKQQIAQKWGIAPAQILFHATHTHGGPQTTNAFSPILGQTSADYPLLLEREIMQAIAQAHDDLEPVMLEHGTGTCPGIGINRRKIVAGEAQFAPNPEGPNDEEVTVVRCLTASGETKGILFHFTCHPTTTSANRVTSEYCGAAMALLDQTWGLGSSCFLQGCCGDIRPRLLRDDQFYSGTEADIERLGAHLADAVEQILSTEMTPLRFAPLAGWSADVELAFREVPSDDQLSPAADDDEMMKQWKIMMGTDAYKEKQVTHLHIQLLQLAEDFALMGMAGEMVLGYGLTVKQRSGNTVLPLGYSNGMVGYVPVSSQLAEGGYESASSGYLFGYPSPFADDVESRIHDAIDGLLANLHKT